jgi:hypothetical protein
MLAPSCESASRREGCVPVVARYVTQSCAPATESSLRPVERCPAAPSVDLCHDADRGGLPK